MMTTNRKIVEAIYPLSPMQQGMLYETVAAQGSGIHIEQLLCRLTGDLDRELWKRSWEYLVQRHPILRASFVWESQVEPLQAVLRQVTLPFIYQDWGDAPEKEHEERLSAYLHEDRQKGFKLSRPPLLRLALFKIRDQEYQLLWTYHHILLDGWSSALILQEALANYQTLCKGGTPQSGPGHSYERYIRWLKEQDLSQAEQFWRSQLAGFTRPTLPGQENMIPFSAEQQENYTTEKMSLSEALTTRLQAVIRQRHVTLNNLLQGVWAVLLSRYSGMQDVLFGCTVSGRPLDLAGSEKIIGPCINTLPIRALVEPGASFWQWLEHLQEYSFDLQQYEYSPGGLVHQWSGMSGAQRLYESLVVVENYPLDLAQFRSAKLTVSDIRTFGAQTSYALTILAMLNNELELACVYNSRRLVSKEVRQILEHMVDMLHQLVEGVDYQIALLQERIPQAQIPTVYTPLLEDSHMPSEAEGVTDNPLEKIVCNIWQEVLGRESIGLNDNFFAIGGHSLLATQLVVRIRATLQLDLSLRSLFDHPTIAGLTAHLTRIMEDRQGLQRPAIQVVARDQELPLSLAQQRLWFLSQVGSESTDYNVAIAIYLSEEIDASIMKRSLSEIVRRHENLRISIHTRDGQPFQLIGQAYPPLPLVDLSSIATEQRKAAFTSLAEREAQQPFHLEAGPLLRTTLVCMRVDEYVLLVTTHHIISDAWSVGVFVRELDILYRAFVQGEPSPLPELTIQYVDFALWQRRWLQGEALKKLIAYWTKQLEGAAPAKLPTDRDPMLPGKAHGAVAPFTISPELTAGLNRLSKQEGTTLFMTLLAAFQVLLYRYSGQKDIVVGTDIANRTQVELEPLIGFFVNVLPLRTNLSGDPSFHSVLHQVREVVLNAYTHQDLPFDKLIDALKLERSEQFSQTPLIHALFVLQNIALAMEGIISGLEEIRADTTRFNLGIFMREEKDRIIGYVNYSTRIFDEISIVNLIKRYQVLLNSIVLQPAALIDSLEIYSEEEKQGQLIREAAFLEGTRRKLQKAKGSEIDLSHL